jgi:succinate dehydrogenase cytochrome b556 subunit
MAGYYGGKRTQPRGGFQLYSWYFLRMSGVALLVLALGHLFFTHYVKLPYETTFDFVADRYVGPFWRTFDFLLLAIALCHGPLMGAQLSIDDYVHRRGLRLFAVSALWTVGFVMLALGAVTILIFQPTTVQARPGDPMWLADVMGGLLVLIAVGTYVGAIAVAIWLARAISRGSLYWGGWAMVAWILHRAAGLGVAFFLLIHILDIMLINVSPAVYDATVRFYKTPFLIPMEIALVGAVVYHALNGLRVISLDVWVGALRRQRELFFAVVTLTGILVAPSAIFLIFPSLAP